MALDGSRADIYSLRTGFVPVRTLPERRNRVRRLREQNEGPRFAFSERVPITIEEPLVDSVEREDGGHRRMKMQDLRTVAEQFETVCNPADAASANAINVIKLPQFGATKHGSP